MMSPWRFIVPPRFRSDTHALLDKIERDFADAVKDGDESRMRKLADDHDDIDELLDATRALVIGVHPDILGLKPISLKVPEPYTVRVLKSGDWSLYFRIQDPPPQGWPVCIVHKKTPVAVIQQRLQEPIP